VLNGAVVIKVGGNEVDDEGWVDAFASAVAGFRRRVVIVHGGGKEVTELQRTLDAEPSWHEGLRVTTPSALKAVSMVLSGLVNKRLVSALIGAGVQAAGVSGEDASLLQAEPSNGGRLGRTGTVSEVNPMIIHTLMAAGIVPVVSPVSRGVSGGALNVNADEAASAVAAALGAESLLMISNVRGYLRQGFVVSEIDGSDVESLIQIGEASAGMGPKLRSAARAAGMGVREVRIGDLGLLTDDRSGTRVLHSPRGVAAC
jgi:acetylglutamate kinase